MERLDIVKALWTLAGQFFCGASGLFFVSLVVAFLLPVPKSANKTGDINIIVNK